jgi:CheY-like chemotaxis protein
VDDDPVNLQVVANHLLLNNISLIGAASGMEALARIEGALSRT